MTPVEALTVHRFLPGDVAGFLAQRVLGHADDLVCRDLDGTTGRSPRRLSIGDVFYCKRVIPEVAALIEPIRVIAERYAGEPVATSPWERSAWSVIVYREGDWIGWHHDTNSLTAVLTLQCDDPLNGTVVTETADERAQPRVSDESVVLPAGSGDLVIFDGKRHLHGTVPYPAGRPRVIVPINLYRMSDVGRAPGTDELIYG